MRKSAASLAFRFAVPVLPLAAATWAGCSDDPGPADPTPDAGPDVQAADVAPPPPADSGSDAGTKRDCAADTEIDGLWKHLDCTGLYADLASKALGDGVKTYKPALEFWSDGAEKQRFVYLPPGAKIGIASFDEWVYPVGTKLWKEFKLGGKRVETRLYMKAQDGTWKRTVYRWTADESDAVRKGSGEKVPVAGLPSYEIPSANQCSECHSGRTEPVLGFDAVGLGVAGATGVTLASLAAEGRFDATPPATQLTIPDDVGGTAAPALGWLHANCGSCHNASAGAGAFFTGLFFLIKPSQLLADGGVGSWAELDAIQTSCGKPSSKSDGDGGFLQRLAPGAPSQSAVSVLAGRRAPEGQEPNSNIQMPPLLSHRVDEVGHQQLDAWITATTVCPPPVQ